MPKVQKISTDAEHDQVYAFSCPACLIGHAVTVTERRDRDHWTFNENVEAPTFTPSVLVQWRAPIIEPGAGSLVICHSVVRNGMITFLPDSTHAMAGKTVALHDCRDAFRDAKRDTLGIPTSVDAKPPTPVDAWRP